MVKSVRRTTAESTRVDELIDIIAQTEEVAELIEQ